MRWTKLNIDEDHSLGLSRFELPWMAASSEKAGEKCLVIKYLGAEGRTSAWSSDDNSAKVFFQKSPLKVTKVVVRKDRGSAGQNEVVHVVKSFLGRELKDRPDDARKYFKIFTEVVRRSVVEDEAAASE